MAKRKDASQDLLDDLVHQFSDPFAFYRELVQNAIDAGSSRIEVELRFNPGVEGGTATAAIADWGEGMNRAIIEDYLLTKFRSSKENDLTKIGKFGIGFVSIFAPEPELVVVETGRDGESWRLLFKPDRSYELFRSAEAFEGTRVTLHKRMGAAQYEQFAQRSRAALEGWCRHSEAEVLFSSGGADGSPPGEARSVVEPFVVDAPYHVEYEEEGTRIVAGPAREAPPFVGLYNRGLTLLETKEALVPGITFKLLSRYLEHTLTRDNVMRDHHFERAISLVRKLAEGELEARFGDANLRAAQELGEGDLRVLWRFAADRGLDRDRLHFPGVSGPVTGEALRRSAREAGQWLPAAPERTALTDRLSAQGVAVLRGAPAGALAAEAAAVLELRGVVPVERAFTQVNAPETEPASTALVEALTPLLPIVNGRLRQVAVAALEGAHRELLAVAVEAVDRVHPATEVDVTPLAGGGGRILVLNRGHPRVGEALTFALERPELAAFLLVRLLTAVGRPLGHADDLKLTAAVLRA